MKGMPSLVGLHTGQQRMSHKRQISDQVQGFMPPEFVREAQRAVHDSIFVEHDSVFERPAADQAHSAEALEILNETEGSRGRQHLAERFASDAYLDFLRAHGRIRVFHEAVDLKIIRGIYTDSPAAIGKFQRLDDLQVTPPLSQTPH